MADENSTGDNCMGENSLIVRRWFEEVWNQRRSATIDEFLAPQSVCYTDEGPLLGPDDFKSRQFDPFVAAFSDLHVQVEGVIAQDDQVAVRWSASGTHDGAGLGFPPTGKPVLFQGMSWIRLEHGQFHEGWQSSNIPQVIQSLAAPPTP